MAILAGFAHNRRVMVQGYHGTGKSTHIERGRGALNWPCVRVNLDSHISRIDLIGRTRSCCATASRSPSSAKASCRGRCRTRRRWCSTSTTPAAPTSCSSSSACSRSRAKLTLLDQNKVIRPHPSFRLFSTANTVGLGDTTGLYHGTQQINQGQMDRWSIVATLNYLPHDDGNRHRLAKTPMATTTRAARSSRPWWRSPT